MNKPLLKTVLALGLTLAPLYSHAQESRYGLRAPVASRPRPTRALLMGEWTSYYGDLHAHSIGHTGYDPLTGEGNALPWFYAFHLLANTETSGGDFIATTNHNTVYQPLWFEPSLDIERTKYLEATSANPPTAHPPVLWGHEKAVDYGDPKLTDHFNIITTTQQTIPHGDASNEHGGFSAFYQWVSNLNPQLHVGQFNHPGREPSHIADWRTRIGGDYICYDFDDFAYDARASAVMRLVELPQSGPGGVLDYGVRTEGATWFLHYDDARFLPSKSRLRYYTRALDRGWHVSPAMNTDRHTGHSSYNEAGVLTWPFQPGDFNGNDYRTGVLLRRASGYPTHEEVLEAVRENRVFASDDANAQVAFKANGFFMGSTISRTPQIDIDVEFFDPDTDSRWFSVDVITEEGNRLAHVLLDAPGGVKGSRRITVDGSFKYYFLQFRKDWEGGDQLVTAPVWVTGSSTTWGTLGLGVMLEAEDVGSSAPDDFLSNNNRQAPWGYTGWGYRVLQRRYESSTLLRDSATYRFPTFVGQEGRYGLKLRYWSKLGVSQAFQVRAENGDVMGTVTFNPYSGAWAEASTDVYVYGPRRHYQLVPVDTSANCCDVLLDSFSLTQLSGAPVSEQEPNDSLASANVLADTAEIIRGDIDDVSDDYFKLTLKAGQTLGVIRNSNTTGKVALLSSTGSTLRSATTAHFSYANTTTVDKVLVLKVTPAFNSATGDFIVGNYLFAIRR
jgi:hypothetical protein